MLNLTATKEDSTTRVLRRNRRRARRGARGWYSNGVSSASFLVGTISQAA